MSHYQDLCLKNRKSPSPFICIFFIYSAYFVLCVLFQSLDYDNIENQLFLEEERRMSYMVSGVGIPRIYMQ